MTAFRLIVLGVLALPLAAFAAVPPAAVPTGAATVSAADSGVITAWRTSTRAALIKRGDVDGYLGAAVLPPVPAGAVYAREAAAKFPNDADALWARWWACSHDHGCDANAAMAPIRKLEPDNAAAWLPRVTTAVKQGDPFAVTAALKRVAQGKRFNDHAWSIGRRAGLAIIALPAAPGQPIDAFKTDQLLFAVANVGSLGMSDVIRVVMACTNLMFFEARKPACNAIAKLLQATGSQQYTQIGLGLADALAQPMAMLHRTPKSSMSAAGTVLPLGVHGTAADHANPEITALHARYRAFWWRALNWVKLQATLVGSEPLDKTIRDAIRTQPNRIAMIDAVLRARGIPLSPPPGWQPGKAIGGK